jgi:electron transport complex protein RnfG
MNKELIKPVIVLALICLFVSGALSVVNSRTDPVIKKAAEDRAAAARKEIIPQADGFELLEIEVLRNRGSLPVTITEIYRTTNDTGFIFMITTPGYGGDIKLICGIAPDGKIIKTSTLSQTETKGIATPVFEKQHESRYSGKDKSLNGVTGVTGATISSNAYRRGIEDALTAFEIIRGANYE